MNRILAQLMLALSLVLAVAMPSQAQRVFPGYTIFVPTTRPSTPDEGTVYQSQTDHKFYIYSGSAWVAVGSFTGGTCTGSVMTAISTTGVPTCSTQVLLTAPSNSYHPVTVTGSDARTKFDMLIGGTGNGNFYIYDSAGNVVDQFGQSDQTLIGNDASNASGQLILNRLTHKIYFYPTNGDVPNYSTLTSAGTYGIALCTSGDTTTNCPLKVNTDNSTVLSGTLSATALKAGDAPTYFTAGGNIPADATSGTYPVPIYGMNTYNKRTVTSVAVRQAASVNFLAVQPASAASNWQRAQYNVVDVGSGDSTGGRYVASQNEVYHWDNHAATGMYGSRNELFNGVYPCAGAGGFCGGGAVTNAYGSYNYIHQQTLNASNAITNAFGSLSAVDSNSSASQITNAFGVSGWIFGDATDPSGLKNIAVAQAGDFEVVPASGTITTAYGVYQIIGPAGGGTVTTGYGNYIDTVAATTKWAYYNNDATAASYSKSNWRAPFHATDASSVLSVASNTIAPTNTVHHLGAGLIKTITVPTMCSPTCTIFIVPDAAFTYDATGNVVVPAGGGTAVTSKTMSFTWDGAKWYPSY